MQLTVVTPCRHPNLLAYHPYPVISCLCLLAMLVIRSWHLLRRCIQSPSLTLSFSHIFSHNFSPILSLIHNYFSSLIPLPWPRCPWLCPCLNGPASVVGGFSPLPTVTLPQLMQRGPFRGS
ncbi:hypothetical protein FQA47_021115 [Oryzias melastigma]|uniref:Uncharacterized protein n=1 Tax=Oryzias melastigma TaxID=30732 RepID=A0A834F4X6_ORYME|nr:hypothetical protein FQA47_021115 [Oryzias melastigma]